MYDGHTHTYIVGSGEALVDFVKKKKKKSFPKIIH